MIPEDIKRIWPAAMKKRIAAKVRIPDKPTTVFGFDTEYIVPDGEYQKNIPVSWQWHDGKRGAMLPLNGEPLKLSVLTESIMLMAKERDPQARHIVLASWFAQAEMSVLDLDIKCDTVSHGSNLFGLRWNYSESGRNGKITTYTITIFDLMAYYGRQSLAKVTAHMPQPKGEWNHAQTTLESYKIPEFEEYGIHDAYLCHQLALDLHHELTLAWGASPFEIASVGAYSSVVFRHYYITKDLMQPHPDIRALALRALRGSGDYGGCYAPGIYEGNFAEYDGTSMYPTAAAALGFMPRRDDWLQWTPEVWGEEFPDRGIFRAQITWPSDEVRRTLLAQIPNARGSEDFGYPVQAVDAWTGYELHAAQRSGCEVRIITGFYFENGTDAFNAYLDQVTAIRAQFVHGHKRRPVHPGLASVYKNMGNTLIGKLAQNRPHIHYRTYYNEQTDRVEFGPSDPSDGLGPVFMPEWWVLIVGYSRAAMMDVIREKAALHAQVDAVLIPECGEEFTHMGITFRKKAEGEKLRLAARNIWCFENGGEVTRFAAGGGARDLPELRAVMAQWEGQKINHDYTVTDLVKLAQHAYDPSGHPLLSRFTTKATFKIPALEGGENGSTKNNQGSKQAAGRGGKPRKPSTNTGQSAEDKRTATSGADIPRRTKKGSYAGNKTAGLGATVKLLIHVDNIRTETSSRRGLKNIQQKIMGVIGSLNTDVALAAAQAVNAGLDGYSTERRGHKFRVEVMD